jgi:hypothetical protein
MSTQGKQARAARDPGTASSRASYRDVLGVGEFRSIFVADIVSMLGNIVAAVALTVLVACMLIPGMPVPGLLALLFANGLISPVYQGVRSAVLLASTGCSSTRHRRACGAVPSPWAAPASCSPRVWDSRFGASPDSTLRSPWSSPRPPRSAGSPSPRYGHAAAFASAGTWAFAARLPSQCGLNRKLAPYSSSSRPPPARGGQPTCLKNSGTCSSVQQPEIDGRTVHASGASS